MASSGTERARRLRRTQTDAEALLWRHLRNRQFAGLKFRRQAPVGSYVVDFLCEDEKLIVELDGGQHSAEADRERTEQLERESYRVIRFWNNEVLGNVEGVLEQLRRFVG